MRQRGGRVQNRRDAGVQQARRKVDTLQQLGVLAS
jgi:hypothetical protein